MPGLIKEVFKESILDLTDKMFYRRKALLYENPCLSHDNTYPKQIKQSHVLHMAIFILLSQELHDLYYNTSYFVAICITAKNATVFRYMYY